MTLKTKKMIRKTDFGKTKNIMIAEFGTGDIWMLGSQKGENGETFLAFKTVKEPRPINVVEKATVKTFDEMKPELVFVFNKVESLDSLINSLKDCKKEMTRKNKAKPRAKKEALK